MENSDKETTAMGKEKDEKERTYRMTLRFGEADHALLERELERTGLSMQKYFEKLLHGVTPKAAPPAGFLGTMKELNRIGVNLNQIAAKANPLGYVDTEEYRYNVRWLRESVSKLMEVMY